MVGTPLASNHGIKVFKRSKCKSTHVIQNLFCGIQIIFSPANTGGGVRCLPTIQVGCYWEHLPLPSQYISYSLDKYPILSFLLYGLCSRALSPTPPIQLSPVGQVGHALEHPTSQLGHVWEHPPPLQLYEQNMKQVAHSYLLVKWDILWIDPATPSIFNPKVGHVLEHLSPPSSISYLYSQPFLIEQLLGSKNEYPKS